MKVIYIKDFVGHVEGHVIDTDPTTAKFLVENKKVCEYFDDKKETIRKDVLDAPGVITSKRKGNPNWTKKQ